MRAARSTHTSAHFSPARTPSDVPVRAPPTTLRMIAQPVVGHTYERIVTMTTLTLPHREVRCRTHGAPADDAPPTWDLYLDGTPIASGYPSASEAQRELDLVAWYAVFGEATLSPDLPMSDEALGLAM